MDYQKDLPFSNPTYCNYIQTILNMHYTINPDVVNSDYFQKQVRSVFVMQNLNFVTVDAPTCAAVQNQEKEIKQGISAVFGSEKFRRLGMYLE